jgi:hypothetical protein
VYVSGQGCHRRSYLPLCTLLVARCLRTHDGGTWDPEASVGHRFRPGKEGRRRIRIQGLGGEESVGGVGRQMSGGVSTVSGERRVPPTQMQWPDSSTVKHLVVGHSKHEVERVGACGSGGGQVVGAVVDGGKNGSVLLVPLARAGVGKGAGSAGGCLYSADENVLWPGCQGGGSTCRVGCRVPHPAPPPPPGTYTHSPCATTPTRSHGFRHMSGGPSTTMSVVMTYYLPVSKPTFWIPGSA